MRSIFLLAAVLLMIGCAENKPAANAETEVATETVAKSIDVPEAVKTAFTTAHPNAEDVEWEMENGRYEVEYEEDNTEASIVYNNDGSIYCTEQDLDVSALPEAVAQAAAKNGEAKEACVMTMADGSMQYEVEIGNTEYIYDANGSLISMSEEEEDDDDDDSEDDDDDDDDDDDGAEDDDA